MSGVRIAALVLALGVASSARAQAFAEPPGWLQQLDLTEAQQEDLTQIYYEYAPAIRKSILAGRRAHEELENLAVAAHLQSGEARELAGAAAQALIDVSELRVQAMRQAYELLTEEQRVKAVRLLVRHE
jgi:Spy/CpxP family protein refolding chaperone